MATLIEQYAAFIEGRADADTRKRIGMMLRDEQSDLRHLVDGACQNSEAMTGWAFDGLAAAVAGDTQWPTIALALRYAFSHLLFWSLWAGVAYVWHGSLLLLAIPFVGAIVDVSSVIRRRCLPDGTLFEAAYCGLMYASPCLLLYLVIPFTGIATTAVWFAFVGSIVGLQAGVGLQSRLEAGGLTFGRFLLRLLLATIAGTFFGLYVAIAWGVVAMIYTVTTGNPYPAWAFPVVVALGAVAAGVPTALQKQYPRCTIRQGWIAIAIGLCEGLPLLGPIFSPILLLQGTSGIGMFAIAVLGGAIVLGCGGCGIATLRGIQRWIGFQQRVIYFRRYLPARIRQSAYTVVCNWMGISPLEQHVRDDTSISPTRTFAEELPALANAMSMSFRQLLFATASI